MESPGYDCTLFELLCHSTFRDMLAPTGQADISKAITEWAEREVMSGNDSESLLILASLNLDKTPDRYEVRQYLERYMREAGLSYPGQEISALVWLRMKLNTITQCDDALTIENELEHFTTLWLDYGPRFFSRTSNYLTSLYYNLFDDYGDSDLYPSPASKMTNEELVAYIKKCLRPFEQKLQSRDWLQIITKDPTIW